MPSRTSRANRRADRTWAVAAFCVRQAAREVRHAARAVLHCACGRGRCPSGRGRGGRTAGDPWRDGWPGGGGQKGPGAAAERSPVTLTEIAWPMAVARR